LKVTKQNGGGQVGMTRRDETRERGRDGLKGRGGDRGERMQKRGHYIAGI